MTAKSSHPTRAATRYSLGRRAGALVAGAALLSLPLACKDSAVPYYTAPTSVPVSVTGIQNAATGLFGQLRTDQFLYMIYTAGYARDAYIFISFDAAFVTELAGVQQYANSDFYSTGVWTREFTNAKQANEIIAAVPKVSDYSSAQASAIIGVMQTIKALNFMYIAETHDTTGVPLYTIVNGITDPFYCNKDVWAYIVALLDSGNANLTAAGSIPLPLTLPAGFGPVSATAAPSTASGSFASFNRALAGKAGLQLAYAIARATAGTAPTPASAGSPSAAILLHADSALLSSALYDTAAIAPPVAGPFSVDAHGVYHTYSAQSGDLTNGVNQYYNQLAPTQDLIADVDTANDLRWKNKFTPNPTTVQQLAPYNAAAAGFAFLPYATVGGPEPIVRAEELALVRAEIQLGLGNFANATALINAVRHQAGNVGPVTPAANYVAVRDALMKELRISTVLEGSADHIIAIRMWGMAAVSDTTWIASSGPDVAGQPGGTKVDYHTVNAPIPFSEIQGRGGSVTMTCP